MRHDPPSAFAAALVLAAAMLAACGSAGNRSADDGRLTVTGSSTMAPFVNDLVRRFEEQHPGARIDVQTGGSSRGIADVRRGTADIGMVSRALVGEEVDLFAHPIAIDGVSLIAHAGNRVPGLSDRQVRDIYTGRITHWGQVGGVDAPITVVTKAEGRATLDLFVRHFGLAREDIRSHVVIGDNQHGILTVAGDANAIAFVSIGTARAEATRGVPIRVLPLSGVEATLANVQDGTFPLARPLNLVTAAPASGLTEAFLTFASSSGVHDLVEAHAFVAMED